MYKDGIETKDGVQFTIPVSAQAAAKADLERSRVTFEMRKDRNEDTVTVEVFMAEGGYEGTKKILSKYLVKDGFDTKASLESELKQAKTDLGEAMVDGDKNWIRIATEYVKECEKAIADWKKPTGDAAPGFVNRNVLLHLELKAKTKDETKDEKTKDNTIQFEFPATERPLVNRKLLAAGITDFIWGVGTAINGRVEVELRHGPSGYTEQDVITALKGTRAVRDSAGCDICGQSPASKYGPAQATLCEVHLAAFKEQKG